MRHCWFGRPPVAMSKTECPVESLRTFLSFSLTTIPRLLFAVLSCDAVVAFFLDTCCSSLAADGGLLHIVLGLLTPPNE